MAPAEDAEAIAAACQDPQIPRWTFMAEGLTVEQVVEWIERALEEQRRLEYGYRLVPEARGKGYATEAGRALLTLAEETFFGEILAMIDPRNVPSQNVARKLGFVFW